MLDRFRPLFLVTDNLRGGQVGIIQDSLLLNEGGIFLMNSGVIHQTQIIINYHDKSQRPKEIKFDWQHYAHLTYLNTGQNYLDYYYAMKAECAHAVTSIPIASPNVYP